MYRRKWALSALLEWPLVSQNEHPRTPLDVSVIGNCGSKCGFEGGGGGGGGLMGDLRGSMDLMGGGERKVQAVRSFVRPGYRGRVTALSGRPLPGFAAYYTN